MVRNALFSQLSFIAYFQPSRKLRRAAICTNRSSVRANYSNINALSLEQLRVNFGLNYYVKTKNVSGISPFPNTINNVVNVHPFLMWCWVCCGKDVINSGNRCQKYPVVQRISFFLGEINFVRQHSATMHALVGRKLGTQLDFTIRCPCKIINLF